MPPAKTHQDFMKLVCGVCTRKDLKLRSISSAVLELIKKHHYSGYNLISGDFQHFLHVDIRMISLTRLQEIKPHLIPTGLKENKI